MEIQRNIDALVRAFEARNLPVGFGIKNAATAREMAQYADAVVIGSAIVSKIEQGLLQKQEMAQIIAEIHSFVYAIRQELDRR